ncbi:Ig-like domain-containing protein [Akkermansiaceae bacterium]|nr:Ig-like domain-containing protein [Akkermansiaceae bacterium]
MLDKFHISAKRLTTTAAPTGSPDTLTISLQQNGTFANPPVLSASALSATGTKTITLTTPTSTAFYGFEFALSDMLSDYTLSPGEKATFRIANNAGGNRLYLDNIAISGTIGSGGGGGSDTTAPTPNPMTWASVPAAVNSTSITMTATTASDPSGVEYSFTETSGNPGATNSGWQDSPTYTDTGLQANTQYTYTVTARDKAATPNATAASGSASATTNAYASPVSAGVSTVAASPAAVPADNTTTSNITVTLKDAGGAAVSGKTVSLVGNGSATIQTANSTSNASGVVTFTVKSGAVGTQTFTATGDSVAITQTAAVDFQTVAGPGPVNAGTSTVVASPTSVPADGTTSSTITITLRDASGNPVPNEGVSLAKTSGPGSVTITPVDIQSTNASGQATFAVRSGMAGTGVFTATSITDGIVITQTASVAFTQAGAIYLVALLPDPVSATSSSSTGTIANFYNGSETLANVGTTANRGSMFAAVGTDSDGVSGTFAHTVVYDMGQTISFDGFVHAQRKADGFDDVSSIDFWVTNNNPGNASTAIPLAIFSTQPVPDASVNLTRNSAVLNEYLLPGGTLSGRYVVMRLNSARTSGANPGGYTLLLGQTASVSDFDTWASAYPGLGASGNDDDGDGISNDAERIFGLNPQNPSSANPIAIPFDPDSGTFSYTRRTQSLTGLTYKAWYSTDLVDWYWESGAIHTPRAPVGDVEIVDVTLAPELLNESKLFIQMSAENFGVAPVMSQIWGSGSSITMVFSEAMDPASTTNPQNYTVSQSGGGTIAVSSATLSADGKTVTLTLAAPLGIDGDFTVTTNRIANAVGQPLGNGTSGQFQTWDDNPNGIKVFILAGQSNMVGYGMSETGNGGVAGAIGSLRHLAVNNGSYPEYDYAALLADPGQPATSAWKTRSDVKVWWRNGHSGNLGEPVSKGDLGPPFKGANSGWFGPEYAFGQVLGDYYPGENEQVLIIKAAWGGHNLVSNFRPPSAVAKRGGVVGASYYEIFNNAREVLSNLGTEFPEWAGRGYQIVGFGWHQGTSDRAPASAADEYKDNLPDFISDVRAEFGKPNLPFAIATTGMNNAGPAEAPPYTGYHAVEKAQLWVAGVAKPANVLSSDTRPFWRDSSISPSTTSFHWNHNAESYFLVGKALGDDMVDLLAP